MPPTPAPQRPIEVRDPGAFILDEALLSSAANYAEGEVSADDLVATSLSRLAWRRRRGVKECQRCKGAKPVAEFGQNARHSDGLNRVCRGCRSA